MVTAISCQINFDLFLIYSCDYVNVNENYNLHFKIVFDDK